MDENVVRQAVKERYGAVARESRSCCGCGAAEETAGCSAESLAKAVGYTETDFASAPTEANLGLGCGNPVALASLRPGETVVDLGSGAGFDCFLAARKVGETGRVIGVDMTPEMLTRARDNAQKHGFTNVEFRQGDIEALPLPGACADAVISNCVINLSPDKPRVFAETFRVLKPGGRLMVSDIVLKEELPEAIRQSLPAYVGCIAGALLKTDYLDAIRGAGFDEVEVLGEAVFPLPDAPADPALKALLDDIKHVPKEDLCRAAQSVISVKVRAVKPSGSYS